MFVIEICPYIHSLKRSGHWDYLDLLAAYSNEPLIIIKTILPKQKKKTSESVFSCI
jgi:hypothetical protein